MQAEEVRSLQSTEAAGTGIVEGSLTSSVFGLVVKSRSTTEPKRYTAGQKIGFTW